MLEKLTQENVTLKIEVDDWEDAIRKSSEALLENDYISEQYVDAMIDVVHRMGAYIVIGKGIALAHARPEFGVKKLGIHFTTLANPVPFGNEKFDPVELVITLAALDNDSHLDLMSELAELLMDSENVNYLTNCTNQDKFVQFLSRFSEE